MTGVCSKFLTGTGVGTWNSSPRECQGFGSAGTRAMTIEYTRFTTNTNIETPNRNAETDTKSLRPCRRGAYVDTRRGIPSRPAAKRGANVRLKNTNVPQKWSFASI